MSDVAPDLAFGSTWPSLALLPDSTVADGATLTIAHADSATLLTTVVSVDPIYVYVDMDEASFLKFNALTSANKLDMDADGKVLEGATSGNLCILESWPGQMRTVYGDHQRFIDTYFKTYPGMYFTGDGARRERLQPRHHIGGDLRLHGDHDRLRPQPRDIGIDVHAGDAVRTDVAKGTTETPVSITTDRSGDTMR